MKTHTEQLLHAFNQRHDTKQRDAQIVLTGDVAGPK